MTIPNVVALGLAACVAALLLILLRLTRNVRISILPKTPLGRWSVGLTIAFILFLVLAEVLTGFELPSPESNPVLAVILTIVVAGISGAAFVTGLISMIKNRERSVLVFVGIAIALWLGLIGAVGYLFI